MAALRATEKGYRVGVMESGKRWNDEDIPNTSWDIRKFAWQPEAECTASSGWSFWTMSWFCAAPGWAVDRMSTANPDSRRKSFLMPRMGRDHRLGGRGGTLH